MSLVQKRTFVKSQLWIKKPNFIALKKPLKWGGGTYINFTIETEKIQYKEQVKGN